MKVVFEDKIYVQKKDVAVMLARSMTENGYFPNSIMKQLLNKKFVYDDKTKNEFMEFTDPEEIEFINSKTWCLDYWILKDKSVEVLAKYGNSLIEEIKALDSMLNISQNKQEIFDKQVIAKLKIDCLYDIIKIIKGEVKMKMPKESKKSIFSFGKKPKKR